MTNQTRKTMGESLPPTSPASRIPFPTARIRNHIPYFACLAFAGLLLLPSRLRADEDPPGCSLAGGGTGNTSQGGINFALADAHVGDTVQAFPSLGMSSDACKAINATGSVYIATGLLTNFLVNVTLYPNELLSCPVNGRCEMGPYNILITADLIGAPVSSPIGSILGVPKTVRAIENGSGTVLAGEHNESLSDFHTATIRIVTPCIQVVKTCELPPGQGCFAAGTPIAFRGSVTNCGDITLTNVAVIDGRAGPMQLFDPTNGLALTNNVILPPGAYAVFTNSFNSTLGEACAGSATDAITATGTDITAIGGSRASVTNSYSATCGICAEPAIVVTQTCPPAAAAPGGVLTFSGTVTNTGNIPLTNVTVVTDRLLTDGGVLVASFLTLTSGEVRSFSGSYLVPTNVCSLTDTLTAQGTTLCGGVVTANVTRTCAVTNTPRLALTKTCPVVPPAPGQMLVFSGTVTNIGDGAVENIVIVNSQPTNNAPVKIVARLEPGQGVSYSGSYLVPTNVCSLTDTLTARGFDVCGTAVTASATSMCAVTNSPRLVLTKTCPEIPPMPGQQLIFSGTVTNTGDVAVTNIVIVNTQPTNNTPVKVVARLEPGQGVSYSGSYLVPTNICNLTDTLAASGFDVCGTVVTAEVRRTCPTTDIQNPTITCSSNLVFTADAGRCSRSNVVYAISASDNCGVVSTNRLAGLASGSLFPVGVTTNTYRVADAAGNTATCSFTVTVLDTELPGITCPGNLVVANSLGLCGSNVVYAISASDNCGVVSTNRLAGLASGSLFPVGVTTNTYRVADAAGNTATCSFTVTVLDTELPTLTCPANRVVGTDLGQCFATGVNLGTPLATNDNCGIRTVTNNAPVQYAKGVTTVIWTVVDTSGNFQTCAQTVTVDDTELPTLTCATNKTVEVGQSWTFDAPTASDNCGSPVISSGTVTNPACGNTFVATQTWRATDASGNFSECSQVVTVVDTTPPFVSITSPADGSRYGTPATIIVSAGAISLAGPISKLEFFDGTNLISTATNVPNVAGLYTNSVVLTNAPVGTYIFTVRATDPCGLTNTSVPVSVTVVGPVPPDFGVGSVFLNPQNGLWQQLIRMTNTGIATIVSVQAFFTNVQPPGTVIYNANGTTNNEAYVYYNQPILPGATGVMLVQYYTTGHIAPTSTIRFVVLAAPPSPPDLTAGVPVPIINARFLSRTLVDDYFLLDFATKANQQYYIQYAADLRGNTNTVWTTSLLPIKGNGGPARWLDYGPAATESVPKGQPRRFYRVIEMPK